MSLFSKAATTSKYNGSPIEPGSFVLSRTAIRLTDLGKASLKRLTSNGLYNLTLIKPYLVPRLAFKYSIVSSIVSQEEPIATITSVASGAPT